MFFERNELGLCTHELRDNGDEGWWEYDEKGQLTHEMWNDGEEMWIDRDSDGHITDIRCEWHDIDN